MTLAKSKYHGGRRPGAGRPPELTKQLEQAKKLAKQLQAGRQAGLLVLADKAPEIVKLAVELALGSKSEKPNIIMLRTCLELIVKIPQEDLDEKDSPITDLLKRLKANVSITQNNYGVGTDIGERPIEAEYTIIPGVDEGDERKQSPDTGNGG